MAKIFRTEELSFNSDNIRIKSSAEGAFEITNAGGSTLMSRATIESDVSSLQAVDTQNLGNLQTDLSSLSARNDIEENSTDTEVSSLAAKDSDLDTDISSLVAKDSGVDTDISSLHAQRVSDEDTNDSEISSLQAQRESDESTKDTEVSSLQAQRESDESTKDTEVSSLTAKDTDLDTDISSLAVVASENDVRVITVSLNEGDTSKAVTFPSAFPNGSDVSAIGMIKAGTNDAIVACQLSEISVTSATFQFSDDIPAGGAYSLVVMASA
jgi:hypothetical protein